MLFVKRSKCKVRLTKVKSFQGSIVLAPHPLITAPTLAAIVIDAVAMIPPVTAEAQPDACRLSAHFLGGGNEVPAVDRVADGGRRSTATWSIFPPSAGLAFVLEIPAIDRVADGSVRTAAI